MPPVVEQSNESVRSPGFCSTRDAVRRASKSNFNSLLGRRPLLALAATKSAADPPHLLEGFDSGTDGAEFARIV
jgi:hypothetical protein